MRTAELADAEEIADLHLRSARQGFAKIFPPDLPAPSKEGLVKDWAARLDSAPSLDQIVFVAELATSIVGVIVAGRDATDRTCGRISRAYIDPRLWGSRVSRLLIDSAIAHLRALNCTSAVCWIMEPNHRARAAVEHLGMTCTGTRQPTCEGATSLPAGVEDLEYRLLL